MTSELEKAARAAIASANECGYCGDDGDGGAADISSELAETARGTLNDCFPGPPTDESGERK